VAVGSKVKSILTKMIEDFVLVDILVIADGVCEHAGAEGLEYQRWWKMANVNIDGYWIKEPSCGGTLCGAAMMALIQSWSCRARGREGKRDLIGKQAIAVFSIARLLLEVKDVDRIATEMGLKFDGSSRWP
jgi:hypothetical protein